MSILTLIIQLIISTSFAQVKMSEAPAHWSYSENSYISVATCPGPNSNNRSIIEDFLIESDWSSERTETNTQGLSVSQITVLSDSNYSSVCSSLNNTYQEMLNKKHGGEQGYNVTYYKVGSFYFVVISIRQSEDPNIVTTGLEYLDVYNQNLELIQGYAY